MSINSYIKRREGIGSLFFEIEKEDYHFQTVDIDFDYEFFYTGRQALKCILDTISETHAIDRIWLPGYYCQHVTRWIKKVYENIHFYDADPFTFDNSVDITSFASAKDVVLVNNYWGLCDTISKRSEFPLVVEDHSHGWLTNGCMHSKADYCFVSLRKSLPIPLGGIAWKPNSKLEMTVTSYKADISFYDIFDNLKRAMAEKNLYRSGVPAIHKDNFIKTINDTEDYLDKNHEIIKLRIQDVQLLSNYLNKNYLIPKQVNLEYLYQHIREVHFMKIVKRDDHVAFGLLLLFKDENLWSSLRKYLIEHDIYPSFLWPDNKKVSEWFYLLNIHVDFRYNKDDMLYIAGIINNWTKQHSN